MIEFLVPAGSPPVLGPAIEPVTIEELASFSRFDIPAATVGSPPSANPDYSLVQGFITAAREQTEEETRFALITQTWTLALDRFPGFPINSTGVSQLLPSVPYYMPFYEPSFYQVDPSNSTIDLLRPPVQSIVSIIYKDPLDNLVTLDPATYTLFGNKISLVQGAFWPTCKPEPDCVRVTYTTGFGDAASDVPERAKTAIKFLAGHWFDNRTLVSSETTSEVMHTFRRLLKGFRRLYVAR